MGNKRKREEEKITRKIRKLERKLKRQKRIISSDSSDNDSENENQREEMLPELAPSDAQDENRASPINFHDGGITDLPPLVSPIPQTSSRETIQTESLINVDLIPSQPGPSSAPDKEITIPSHHEDEDELEEDILQILGEGPLPDQSFGKNIHKDIAARWQDILLKGLAKEVKEPIMKKYLVPANCNFLVPPILNPEAKAAVPDILAKRDATMSQKQNQIGIALAALSQVSELILRNETSKQVLLQPLSDACRILCDSHNIETRTRKSILMSSINTSLRDTLASANRDKYLFGEDLAEKLKAAKTVQKTGESLLKINTGASTSKNSNVKINPRRNLNFRGQTQRKPPNRGNDSTRGRPPARPTRTPAYSRQPPPPPRAPSPARRNYRR